MRRRALAWGPVLALVVMALLFGGQLTAWMASLVQPKVPATVAVPAPVAPALMEAEPQWIVPPRPVRVYAPAAKKALALPAAVQSDSAKHVLQAARLAADDSPREVTAVLDEQSGETELLVRELPRPWLDLTPRGEAGAYVGLLHGQPTLRVQAWQQLAQIKALRLGAIAAVDVPLEYGSASAFIGVGAKVTW